MILQVTTVAGEVEGDEPAVRVAYVQADPTAGFVPEGTEIDPADADLAEVIVQTGKVAVLSKLSNEASKSAEASKLISDSMSRAVIVKANTAFLSNPAAGPGPAGLLNLPGITDGGALGGNLDALVDAFTLIESDGGNASHIIAAPDAWAALAKLKAATGSNAPLLGASTGQTQGRNVFGVPVLTCAQAPAGTLVVVDKSDLIAAGGAVTLAVSDHFYFGSDSEAMRVTFRFGAKAVHPARVVKLRTT